MIEEDQTAPARGVSRRRLLRGGLLAAGGAAALAPAAANAAAAGADGKRTPGPETGPPPDRSIRIDKTYRALIRRNEETPARIETVKLLPFGGRQVLVRCTVNQCCYTDSGNVLAPGLWRNRPRPYPLILGHAGMGVVEAIGPEVSTLRVGDKVFIAGTSQCDRCYNCIRGRADACLANNLQQGPVATTSDGIPVAQTNGIGGLAEYSVNYEERLVAYFSDLPDEEVAMMIDIGSTGLGTTCALRQIESGSTVVVIGCGPIGLSAVQGARIQGARKIIAVEPIKVRRDMALKFGAHEAIDPNRFQPAELLAHLKRLCANPQEGRLFAGGSLPNLAGPDYVIEAVGRQRFMPKLESARDPTGLDALQLAIDLTPPGGYCMLSGGWGPDDMVSTNANGLTLRSRTLISCQNGGIQTRRDIPRFIRLIEDGKFDAKSLISKVYPFDDIIQAYQDVADRTVVTAVVRF